MTTFPAANYMTDSARTEGEFKTGLESILAGIKELLGGAAESTLTIASGSVTPTAAVHSVDTEGAVASDDLTNISQTNHPDGRLLLIRCVSASRAVVLKHSAGGIGQLSLIGGADLTLNNVGYWIMLKRTGNLWEEILNNFHINWHLTFSQMPTGTIWDIPYAETPPTGTLECDGSAVSMTTYEALFDLLGVWYGTDTGTTFTADYTTDTLSSAGHGLNDSDVLRVSNSGGALPAGLSASTKYYVINKTTDTYQLSTTLGGSAVNITDNGTGTHKHHKQFKLPDYRGRFRRGWDHGAGIDPDAASRTDRGDGATGDHVGTKQADALDSHTHSITGYQNDTHGNYLRDSGGGATSTGAVTDATGGNETRPVNITVMTVVVY
ncbi:MAG: phage tail protein [Thermodesulfobacteriota bacterium]